MDIYYKNEVKTIRNKITLNENNSHLYGNGVVLKLSEDFKDNCVIDMRSELPLTHMSIENIRIDASKCNKNVKGIIFNQLMYNCIFDNIDFESFQDSWIYNKSNKISEHIKFSMLQGNCREKIYINPLIKIDRLNESTIEKCKFYGKQYHLEPYSLIPLMELDTPQNVNIIGCSFNNTCGTAINITNSKDSRIRKIDVSKCTFEDCRNKDTIKIVGGKKWIGEYGAIKDNSYIEMPGNICVDNYCCLNIEDFKANILLEENSKSNVVKRITDNGTNAIDKGKNKIIIY